jgi:norsolorinic acid ketoreductase
MTTYLITGANRGIGRGLADIILSRPNTTLVALVRDLEDETSRALEANEKGADGTKVIMSKYDAADHAGVAALVNGLELSHLDVVVANAGYMDWRGPITTVKPGTIHEHMDVNAIAPLMLFSACESLLRKSKQEPKFFAISSGIASIATIPKLPHASMSPYGMSKTAMNWAFVRLNQEIPDIDIEILTPGPVRTGLTRHFQTSITQQEIQAFAKLPMVDINDSVNGLMERIDTSSKKTTGGTFRQWDGSVVPW